MRQTKETRPKWAQNLSAKEWRHLKEGRFPQRPTLSALKIDATTCSTCKLILKSLEVSK